jgi:hypothetical protein
MTTGFPRFEFPPAKATIHSGNAARKGVTLATAIIGVDTSGAPRLATLDEARTAIDPKEVPA